MAATRTLITIAGRCSAAITASRAYWAAITLGRHARPDRPARRRHRLRLWSSIGSVGAPAADLRRRRIAEGENRRARLHSRRAHHRHAAATRARPSTSTASAITYPDIRLIYWAGGNPFHHHQDLNRLLPRLAQARDHHRARALVDAAGAPRRHRAARDHHARAQRHRRRAPRLLHPGDAARRSSRSARRATITTSSPTLAERFGFARGLHRGARRDGWLRHLYEQCAPRAAAAGIAVPDSTQFWAGRSRRAPGAATEPSCSSAISARDPDRSQLATPSGKIEIFSETVAGFGYDDCPGHAAWMEPAEWLGSPLRRPLSAASHLEPAAHAPAQPARQRR